MMAPFVLDLFDGASPPVDGATVKAMVALVVLATAIGRSNAGLCAIALADSATAAVAWTAGRFRDGLTEEDRIPESGPIG